MAYLWYLSSGEKSQQVFFLIHLNKAVLFMRDWGIKSETKMKMFA